MVAEAKLFQLNFEIAASMFGPLPQGISRECFALVAVAVSGVRRHMGKAAVHSARLNDD